MNLGCPKTRWKHRGLTFLEVSIVIGVMLAMTAMLLFGVRSWRVASDRSTCIINQRNVQLALRSYQNMYGFAEGASPTTYEGSQNISDHLFHREFVNETFYDYLKGEETCPANGTYTVTHPTVFPPDGALFMRCSQAITAKHVPQDIQNW